MRAVLLRFIGVLIVPFGLLCLLFPFAYLVWPDGPMLLDDTRGFFGAGTDDGVPVVHQVACMEEHYGGSGGRRGMPSTTEYQCDLMLSADPAAKEADPYTGMTYDESMKKFYESIRAQERGAGTTPDRITRTFASDVSSEPPPRLRRLSAAGVSPPRYAVIFDGGELGARWAHWFFMSLLMGGFGVACLFATRACFRRARGEAPF